MFQQEDKVKTEGIYSTSFGYILTRGDPKECFVIPTKSKKEINEENIIEEDPEILVTKN